MKKRAWPGGTAPLAPPIVQSSVFQFESLRHIRDVSEEEGEGHVYSRYGHPNAQYLEEAAAELEGAEACRAFSSGMAAMVCALLSLCRPGDHILAVGTLYGGTHLLLREQLQQMHIDTTFVPDPESAAAAVTAKTRVIVAETISNPRMDVLNFEPLAYLAERHDLFFLVDNTFASPCLCRPLEQGAHGVMHSATKYLNGHGDAMAGLLLGSRRWIEEVSRWAPQLGAVLDPFAAWLVHRSLATLSLRMQAHSANGRHAAEFLHGHLKVKQVYYPGLDNSRLADRYLPAGCSGMVGFVIDGDPEQVIAGFEHIVLAPSLADTATTVSHPASTSHKALTEEERMRAGVPWELLRLSVGIEEAEAIVADLGRGLDRI